MTRISLAATALHHAMALLQAEFPTQASIEVGRWKRCEALLAHVTRLVRFAHNQSLALLGRLPFRFDDELTGAPREWDYVDLDDSVLRLGHWVAAGWRWHREDLQRYAEWVRTLHRVAEDFAWGDFGLSALLLVLAAFAGRAAPARARGGPPRAVPPLFGEGPRLQAEPRGKRPGGPNPAYEEAASGGRHGGTLKNYADRPTPAIEKAVRGYEKQVAEHGDKIANPAKYAERWSQMSPREQAGLVEKWKGDLQRNQSLADVLRGLLETRR